MRKDYLIFAVLCLFSVGLLAQSNVEVIERGGKKIVKGEIIVKVKEEFRGVFVSSQFSQTSILPFFDKFSISNISKRFSHISKPRVEKNRDGYTLVDLSTVYTINYTKDFNEFVAAEMLYSSGLFEYVEVQVIPELLYTPDDPKVSAQYHLTAINAFDAWDIQTGDTNVVIGITDTGIDSDHPDLVGRIKLNYNDPVDGVDNDLDGYIDNYIGWDVGENDNDPEVWKHHGNQVTGMAVANTNNGENIAAVGHDVMVLPVKIANSNGYLTGAYNGIIYAADHGADIINCSWGGAGNYNQYNQDVINYATINKGAVVVAAAGNSNVTAYFYPASYSNVISVGGTDALDQKWVQSANEGSQFNDKIDVVAPAHNVVALWRGGSSGLIGRGTSFAAPIVSGIAGLVKSEYPNASPQKIAAIIKASTDDIYSVPGNEVYAGMLGTGRVNAHKALLPISTPFITYFNHSTDDGFEQNLAQGDTVDLSLELVNQLGATNNVSVIVRSFDGMTEMLDSTSFITTLGANENKETATEFKFVVSGTAGINAAATFEIEITDGSNVWFDNFSVQVNKDYIDITNNNLNLSFNNYGRIGYTYTGAGLGVDYNGAGSMIKEMGVLLGVSPTNVLSYEDYELLSFDPAYVEVGSADFGAKGTLDDAWSMSPIGVVVDQHAYAWSSAPNDDYIIYEYVVKNPTGSSMDDIYLGVFGDWDIGNANSNNADFDASKNLGYVYESGGMYGGIKALRSSKVNYYAFDKSGNDGINIKDGFNDDEEFESMSTGLSHTTASGDVAHMVSHGPYSIPAGDSIVVAFAIVGGSDLSNLQAHAQSAESMYESLRGINITVNNIENNSCSGSADGIIDLGVDLYFEPYSVDWHHDSTETSASVNNLESGNYNLEITDKNGISKIMNFSISEPEVLTVDLLSAIDVDCHGVKNGTVDIAVEGGTGSYIYDWNNPSIPSIENPQLPAGSHKLVVSDLAGCTDTLLVEIDEPTALSVSTVWLLDDTASTCEGEASILGAGGISPYSYSWNNGAPISNGDVYGLCKGDYTIIVADANGCEIEHHVLVDAPEEDLANGNGANGVEEIVTNFKLYPNPANEYLIAEFKSLVDEEMSITVVDVKGRLIQRVYADKVGFETYKVILNATKYQVGNYFIRMISSKGASTYQFEVQH